MRILLDSRDLIDLLEHQQPTTVAEFRCLPARGKTIKSFSRFTNVKELAGPIGARSDYAEVESYFRSPEQLLLVYLKRIDNPCNHSKFVLAVDAF